MNKIILTLIGLLIVTPIMAQDKESINFFESKVRPLLSEKCYNCHSAKEKIKGGLTLDTKEGFERGGESGVKLTDPKNVAESLIIKSVKRVVDSSMPPKESDKLTTSQVKILEDWVKMGAPYPSTPTAYDPFKDARTHWAYQPLIKTKPPTINNGWVENDIDKFILSKQNEVKLKPSLMADKHTTIRRLYYNLIGLPPTEEQIELFINDKSSNAYEKLVDKLLNSPQYGEKWARTWLDTSRYSDTTGTVNANRETRYTYSWTYRNYVIDAFNNDKPFNEFIIEQIAADKLTNIPKSNLAALGFITLGKDSGNQNDTIDDRIDVVTKGFMATTMVCARCHDHKFDPFTMKDYYALHGIFNNSLIPEDKDKPLLITIVETPEYKDYLQKRTQIEVEIDNFINTRFTNAMSDFKTNTGKWMYGNYLLQSVVASNRNDFIRTNTLNPRMMQKWGESIRLQVSVGRRSDGKMVDRTDRVTHPVFYPYAHLFNTPQTNFVSKYQEMLKTNSHLIDPYLLGKFKNSSVRNMYDLTLAYQSALLYLDKVSTNMLTPDMLKFKDSIYSQGGPLSMNRLNFQKSYGDNGMTMRYDNELRQQRGRLVTHELTHPATPPRAMALSDRDKPSNSPIFIKGDASKRGEVVPRRFVEIFKDVSSQNFTNGSGRLELAQAIANPKNPLTARVIVNRVWQSHFGVGFVNTPDDFGLQTPKPLHYDLHNYLSTWFMENGWSIKKLNKLIVMSSTYRQDSLPEAKKLTIDPYNQYYWRMNLQRIKFEELRDTILYIGGSLNTNRQLQSIDLVTINNDGYADIRSIYGLIDRGRLPEVFTTFDFATPEMTTGKRFNTTVPKQALFLMNNPMVIEQVRNLVNRPEFIGKMSEEEKVKMLYNICYQRNPNDLEIKVAKRFITEAKQQDRGDYRREYNWSYGVKTSIGGELNEFKYFYNGKYKTIDSKVKMTNPPYLSVDKGMPINYMGSYTVRRWTCSAEGEYQIQNLVKLIKPNYDGINYVVVVNGKVHTQNNVKQQYQQNIDKLSFKVGDVVDFMISCNKNIVGDEYTIDISIVQVKDMDSLIPLTWNSKKDFKGPVRDIDKELNSWERYAHILLMSNEMIFIN